MKLGHLIIIIYIPVNNLLQVSNRITKKKDIIVNIKSYYVLLYKTLYINIIYLYIK